MELLVRAVRRYELPTWGVLFAVYAGFGLLTWSYQLLPWWLLLPLGGWLVCWHSQLQHECLHGHPTRSALLNGLLAAPSLGLWLPYLRYRDAHLEHHRSENLTDPLADNESMYVTASRWARLPAPARWLLWINQTLAGRMLVGPPLVVAATLWAEIRLLLAGDGRAWLGWLLHVPVLAALLFWLLAICQIPLWAYVLLFVWPGMSLTLLRSYYEHRPAPSREARSVLIERGGLLGLLFLNNNLHALHHAEPGLAWFELPRVFAARRAELRATGVGYWYRGYGDWFRRYLFRPKDSPVHPGPA